MKPKLNEDVTFGYWFGGYYYNSAVSPTSPNSPLSLSVTQTPAPGTLGNFSSIGKNYTYTVTVKNTGKNQVGVIEITFRLASCLAYQY